MISFFQLDPASLTLWINSDLVGEHRSLGPIAELMEAAIRNDDAALVEIVESSEAKSRARMIALSGSIWHEKRHFLDLILTNYGAFRWRQFFEVAANLPQLLTATKQDGLAKLGLPVEIYDDPLRLRKLGLQGSDLLANLGRAVSARKQALSEDRRRTGSRFGLLELGGEAQLEALAYLHQTAKSQQLFGAQQTREAIDEIPAPDAHFAKYRSIMDMLIQFEIVPSLEVSEDVLVINDGVLQCVLYASLCCRVWKQKQVLREGVYSYLPGYRLSSILLALRDRRVKFELGTGVLTIWAKINEVCGEIFGRSVLEELDADFAMADARYRDVKKDIVPALREVTDDLQSTRRKLIKVLNDDPERVLGTYAYQSRLLPLLDPKVVLCSPQGAYPFEDKSGNTVRIFGYNHGNVAKFKKEIEGVTKWSWAIAINGYTPVDDSHYQLNSKYWMTYLSEVAPITKLVINGQKHKTMLGPEMVHAEARLQEQLAIPIVIDKAFQQNEYEIDPNLFRYLTFKNTFRCDILSVDVDISDSDIFTKWLFINDQEKGEALLGLWAQNMNSEILARLTFWKNWAPWVVSKSISPLTPNINFAAKLRDLAGQEKKSIASDNSSHVKNSESAGLWRFFRHLKYLILPR